jgi:manganese/zinc/iron transport system permease protein
MPTGPWIVLVISVIALFSFFFAPKRGILARWLKQHQLRKTITDENLLKELYHLGELDQQPYEPRSLDQILEERYFPAWELRFALGRLQRQGYLTKDGHRWKFTKIGYKKGRRMVKLHRLWEVYLSQYMRIAPDHVHEDAETIEHVITPELEARLEHMLKFPDQDPHKSTIPYA